MIRRTLFKSCLWQVLNRDSAETKVTKCHVCWEVKSKNVVFTCRIKYMWTNFLTKWTIKSQTKWVNLSAELSGNLFTKWRHFARNQRFRQKQSKVSNCWLRWACFRTDEVRKAKITSRLSQRLKRRNYLSVKKIQEAGSNYDTRLGVKRFHIRSKPKY